MKLREPTEFEVLKYMAEGAKHNFLDNDDIDGLLVWIDCILEVKMLMNYEDNEEIKKWLDLQKYSIEDFIDAVEEAGEDICIFHNLFCVEEL